MPKRTGKPRYHKESGKGYIELGGERIYLQAEYGTKECQEEYEQRYGQWLANGKKPPPSKSSEATGLTCNELVIHYLDEMEEYHVKQRKSYLDCRKATSFLTKHFGNELAANFTPLSLKFIRKKLVEHGYVRKKVNYFVNQILYAPAA